MSWIKHPGKLRILTFSVEDLWVGAGADAGRYAYKTTVGGHTKYVVTEGFIGYKLRVGGTVLEPVFSDVNGEFYFQGGNLILYKSAGSNWILMESESWNRHPLPPGYRPVSWFNSETRQTEGDAWWEGGLPTRNTEEFTPCGTATGTKTVEFYMPRWEKTRNAYDTTNSLTSNALGTYIDPEGHESDLTVGVRRWRDNHGTYYEKSLETVNWSFVYGSIHRDARNEPWVIGTYESPDGWMEGEEPNTETPVTFTFTTNSVNDLTATIYELFAHGYEGTYSPVFYDSATQTFRISVPEVTASVGWLECSEATFNTDLTFTDAEENRVYNLSDLLKGTITGLEARDDGLFLNGLECRDERLDDSVTFTYTHVEKDNLTIIYNCLIFSGSKTQDVVIGETAIWR